MSRRLEIAGILGLVAPFFSFACILVAVASWKPFNWVNNALSDLGVQSGVTSVVFNSGLVISGILFIIFSVGLLSLVGKRLVGKVGSALFAFACIALIAIGIFNESFSPTHYIASVLFFVFLPISQLVLVAAFWLAGRHKLGVFTLAVGLAAAAPWVLEFSVHYVANVAIPEFASGLIGAIWAFVLGYVMLRESQKPK